MTGRRTQVKPRPYDSRIRQQRSGEVRQRILDSARSLFLADGYHGTKVAAIADHAGVHVDTVYALVGRKPFLLHQLIEQAISGTDRAVRADDRDYVQAIRAEPDAVRKLELYARAMRRIQSRMAPLFYALRDAAAVDPEAEAVWRTISDRRAANMRLFVADVQRAARLHGGLSLETAADTIWLLCGSETYVLLTRERGWSPARYERWLVMSMTRILLDEHPV